MQKLTFERKHISGRRKTPISSGRRKTPIWRRYQAIPVGATGAGIGMHTFGSSAPLKDLLTKFCFTPAKALAEAR